ncbi:hypothetical protein PTQ19_07240 [Microbacterium esteraromaticum]|uniref:hypothetical protein n=1 Tax=Microbacterium esteraromaticum TaxID=57043 RepID=UPI0023676932|nr:hypothetical protein [Microbacterium esteraromaticum]WDH80218.1 hypothetical protein PTQ19_07240 [Microbacterium esteraromaticum]
MSSRPLDPLTTLSVELSAAMSRNRYTTDPGPVIAELQRIAGEHPELLAEEAGLWAGFNEADPDSAALVDALKAISTLEAVALGRERSTAGSHFTPPLI